MSDEHILDNNIPELIDTDNNMPELIDTDNNIYEYELINEPLTEYMLNEFHRRRHRNDEVSRGIRLIYLLCAINKNKK